jgi:hypothetical protein
MLMTTVASIKVGTEVTCLYLSSPSTALFATAEGRVGRVRTVREEEFRVLRRAERRCLEWMEDHSGCFGYGEWKRRTEEDKLVDVWLVDRFEEECRRRGGEDDYALLTAVRAAREQLK